MAVFKRGIFALIFAWAWLSRFSQVKNKKKNYKKKKRKKKRKKQTKKKKQKKKIFCFRICNGLLANHPQFPPQRQMHFCNSCLQLLHCGAIFGIVKRFLEFCPHCGFAKQRIPHKQEPVSLLKEVSWLEGIRRQESDFTDRTPHVEKGRDEDAPGRDCAHDPVNKLNTGGSRLIRIWTIRIPD